MSALWVAWNGCGDCGRERSEDGVSLWRGGGRAWQRVAGAARRPVGEVRAEKWPFGDLAQSCCGGAGCRAAQLQTAGAHGPSGGCGRQGVRWWLEKGVVRLFLFFKVDETCVFVYS